MYSMIRLVPAAATLCLLASPVQSNDARAIALGGSAIANGAGVHGVLENPASLMAMQRRGQKFHIRFGFGAEIRDTGSAIDTLTADENENLVSDIESEIDILSQKTVECTPALDSGDTVCVSGTQSLSDISERVLDVIDSIDDETIDGQATADLGIAFTKQLYPVAFHIQYRGTGAGSPNIDDSDRAYVQEFATVLDGDSLTLDESRNAEFIDVPAFGVTVEVSQPEDVLQSTGRGSALLRTQYAFSLAQTISVGGFAVDAGVTPKFSTLNARSSDVALADEFDDTADSVSDRFKNSEVEESSFTFDVGGTLAISRFPMRLAAVLRNVIPESIETTEAFEFETTPQLIVGGVFYAKRVSITADLALNEAKVDNFETQKIAVGVEFGSKLFAVRGGLSHDAARSTDTTALSLGFGLGPLQIGGRLSGQESAEASAQLSFSF